MVLLPGLAAARACSERPGVGLIVSRPPPFMPRQDFVVVGVALSRYGVGIGSRCLQVGRSARRTDRCR